MTEPRSPSATSATAHRGAVEDPMRRLAASRAMARCAAGDEASFDEVYRYLAPRLLSTLRRRTRDLHQAEDLLQQATLRMYRFRAAFDPDRDVVRWAYGIVKHLWVDEIRRRRKDPLSRAITDDGSVSLDRFAADGDCAARELADRFQTIFISLPGAQREAFQLLRIDGLSHEEAAQRLGITVPAVKLRAHRAYAALRTVLLEAVEPDPAHAEPVRRGRGFVSQISRPAEVS